MELIRIRDKNPAYGSWDPIPKLNVSLFTKGCFVHLDFMRKAVLGIQMFLGLLDPNPDPLVRGTAPAPDPSLFS